MIHARMIDNFLAESPALAADLAQALKASGDRTWLCLQVLDTIAVPRSRAMEKHVARRLGEIAKRDRREPPRARVNRPEYTHALFPSLTNAQGVRGRAVPLADVFDTARATGHRPRAILPQNWGERARIILSDRDNKPQLKVGRGAREVRIEQEPTSGLYRLEFEGPSGPAPVEEIPA